MVSKPISDPWEADEELTMESKPFLTPANAPLPIHNEGQKAQHGSMKSDIHGRNNFIPLRPCRCSQTHSDQRPAPCPMVLGSSSGPQSDRVPTPLHIMAPMFLRDVA